MYARLHTYMHAYGLCMCRGACVPELPVRLAVELVRSDKAAAGGVGGAQKDKVCRHALVLVQQYDVPHCQLRRWHRRGPGRPQHRDGRLVRLLVADEQP
jgi:hypothetical protein